MREREGNKKKPLVYLFKSPIGTHLYDVNMNEVLNIPGEVYAYLMQDRLKKANDSEKPENNTVISYIEGLKQKGYLKTNRVKISENPATEYYSDFINHNLGHIALQVTQRCNLNCEYCVYSGNYNNRTHSNKDMSLETAYKAIDYILSHSRDVETIAISFYGGEPLLAYDLIKQCVNYTLEQAQGRKVHFNFTTNGTLLTEEKLDFLVSNDFSILVSLDGSEKTHNRHRKFAHSKKGSFDVLMKNISYIKLNYPEYFKRNISFNTVLDPEQELYEIALFTETNDTVKDSSFSSTVINDVNAKKEIPYSDTFIKQYEYEKFKALLQKLGRLKLNDISPLMRGHFSNIKQIGIMLERISQEHVPTKAHRGGPCMPGVKKIFINADGLLFPCERVSETSSATCIGNIESGVILEKALSLLNIEKATSDSCQNCWAYAMCDICVAHADNGERILGEKILDECEQSKANFDAMLKDYVVLKEYGYDYELDL